MSTDVGVYVSVGARDVFAGRLYSHRRRNVESAGFVYSDRYLARADAFALDPELPLSTGTHQVGDGRPMFGAFADSNPDRWGRMLITRAERRRARDANETPRSLGEFDLLLGVRDDLRQVTVPDSRLIGVGRRAVLVIDRFDRRAGRRIGYASAMTMLRARDGGWPCRS